MYVTTNKIQSTLFM